MANAIQMRLGFDRNSNQLIERDEVVKGFSELTGQDLSRDGKLEGRELVDVFYEYGRDQWLPADRTTELSKDGWRTTLRLQQVDLENGKLDLQIQMRPQ